MKIEDAINGHHSANTFLIRTDKRVLYEGDRHEVPDNLRNAEIKESWYRIREKDTPPKWEFRVEGGR